MKTSTLSVALLSLTLFLGSCGEHDHDHGDKSQEKTAAEMDKASEEIINAFDNTINEINSKEAELEAALEELDF